MLTLQTSMKLQMNLQIKSTVGNSCEMPETDDGFIVQTYIELHSQMIGQTNDPGWWGILSQDSIRFWIEKGPLELTKHALSIRLKKQTLSETLSHCSFHKMKKTNDETYCSEWLLNSVSIGNVYCFVGKLFLSSESCLSTDGFDDWKHLSIRQKHESSMEHRNAMLSYLLH